MRAIIILIVIALLMGLAGWLTLGHEPGKTSINIETQEIKEDTQNAVENTEDLIESGVETLRGNESGHDQSVPDPLENLEDEDVVQPAPVDIDKEPVKTSPTESPVTSPVATP